MDLNCPICLLPAVDDNRAIGNLMRTRCAHYFHLKCMKAWQNSHMPNADCCPVCRYEMSTFWIDVVNDQELEIDVVIAAGSVLMDEN